VKDERLLRTHNRSAHFPRTSGDVLPEKQASNVVYADETTVKCGDELHDRNNAVPVMSIP